MTSDPAKRMATELLHRIAQAGLLKLHGRGVSTDYVLGYQRCAKDMLEAVEESSER